MSSILSFFKIKKAFIKLLSFLASTKNPFAIFFLVNDKNVMEKTIGPGNHFFFFFTIIYKFL